MNELNVGDRFFVTKGHWRVHDVATIISKNKSIVHIEWLSDKKLVETTTNVLESYFKAIEFQIVKDDKHLLELLLRY